MRERIRAGDPAAFEQLFTGHVRQVYAHAVRLTGDRGTAEDITSLTYLHAWRRRGRVERDGGSLLPWLLGITTNLARNAARAARRDRAFLARLPVAVTVPDIADEALDALVARRRLATMRPAYDSLSRGEQDVIALHVWAGLSHAETAQVLGVAVGTVKSRLARARRKLGGEPHQRGRQVEGDRPSSAQLPREERP